MLGDPQDRFVLVAESEIAVLFAAEVAAAGLEYEAASLSARIGAFLGGFASGNPKAWEAYLCLVVSGGISERPSLAAAVERDLQFCRKLVIDADVSDVEHDPNVALASAIAPLLPLVLDGAFLQEDPFSKLDNRLVVAGQPRQLVSLMFDSWRNRVESAADLLESAEGRFQP